MYIIMVLYAVEILTLVFWHWMWQEAGKPQSGAVYEVMKRTEHQYHYAVRRCNRNKLVIQKETLARNINKSKEFWT